MIDNKHLFLFLSLTFSSYDEKYWNKRSKDSYFSTSHFIFEKVWQGKTTEQLVERTDTHSY